MQGKIAVVDPTDFVNLLMTHKLMKKYNVEAVAAAKDARMKVAAVTLSNLAQSERFVNVPAPPATAPPSGPADGPILAPSVQARGDGPILAPSVEMYGKKMRDVHMAGFFIKSDSVVRFRSSDDKVVVADLLMAIGRYSRTDNAQDAIVKLMDRNDEMVKDLDSIEVDKTLTDMVSTYFLNQNI